MRRHPTRGIAALVVLVCLAFVPSALASTVSKSGGQVVWTAKGGVDDAWYISQTDTNTITLQDNNDSITLDPGATDCTQDSSSQVTCANTTGVEADSLDGADYIDARQDSTIPTTLNGGDGPDDIWGSEANDTINGGAGDDSEYGYQQYVGSLSTNGAPSADGGGQYYDCYYAYYYQSPCGLHGDGGNDTITGGDGRDAIWGDYDYAYYGDYGCCSTTLVGGNDTIDAGPGEDFVDGEDGNDTIDGGTGDDGLGFYQGYGSSQPGLYGGPGNDTIRGGDGVDFVQGDGGDAEYTQNQAPWGNDNLDGGAGNDFVVGDNENYIDGCGSAAPGGNDVVQGGDGDDALLGEGGSDQVIGGNGDDQLVEYNDASPDSDSGGSGTDTAYYIPSCVDNSTDSHVDITLDGQPNDGFAAASGSGDQSDNQNNVGTDIENVSTDNSDVPTNVTGDGAANAISTGGGPDNVDAGDGPDNIQTNDGPDKINSRDGYPDSVDCGPGVDSVTADEFDTFTGCENVDVAQVPSAYAAAQPQSPPPPPPALDITPPNTTITSRSTFTVSQLLNGINVTVTCNEECQGSVRLLGVQPPGSVQFARAYGFNTTLARTTLKYKAGKRTVRVRPCERKANGPQSKQCLARLRKTANARLRRHSKFSLKIYVITIDHRGNRTEKTKVISIKRG
jgi:hypothetical protein